MKIVFMGTPDFAVPSLQRLIDDGHEIMAVVTKEDKPKGRGQKMVFSPIKELAIENDIRVLQPNKVRNNVEFIEELKEINPDVMVVIAYGQILPKEVLDIPAKGCINVHGSLLPKYRGAAPIQWAVIDGEKVTGVTTMYMDEGMDTGDMLLKSEVEIGEEDNSGTIFEKLSIEGADLISKTLKKIETGEVVRIKQNDEEATYTKMIDKKMGLINWSKPAEGIKNLIKGLSPWPSAYTYIDDKMMKIWSVNVIENNDKNKKDGEILEVGKKSFIINTSEGALEVYEIQMQNSKRMSVEDFLKGNKLEIGKILGL